jgi:hypothetical protein
MFRRFDCIRKSIIVWRTVVLLIGHGYLCAPLIVKKQDRVTYAIIRRFLSMALVRDLLRLSQPECCQMS